MNLHLMFENPYKIFIIGAFSEMEESLGSSSKNWNAWFPTVFQIAQWPTALLTVPRNKQKKRKWGEKEADTACSDKQIFS